MEIISSMHKRSKSDLGRKNFGENKWTNIFKTSHHLKLDMGQLKSCVEVKRQQCPTPEVQNSLKKEVLQLQEQLEDQFKVRGALENASNYRAFVHDPTNGNSITKPANDLIKEIAVLELEVVNLEKYLLSLYRRTFDRRVSSLSAMDEISKTNSTTQDWILTEVPGHDIIRKKGSSIVNSYSFRQPQDSDRKTPEECSDIFGARKLVDSGIYRCHSALSQRSASSFRTSPPIETLAEAVHSCHSLPLSMLEHAQDATNIPGCALETPNWLSEEMIKCISSIYFQLADPPLFGFPSSPISFSSSMSESSPQDQYDMKSSQSRDNPSFNSWSNNPFHIEGSKEFSGSYFTMVEVQCISRDSQRLRSVEHMLQNFRSLVSRLEEVDPRKMKHEEKLAFWINVHNALVMHAYLAYGIPRSHLKRISLLLKAAYNVGGQTISVDMIQNSILGCRLPRPGQWFHSWIFPKTKFKAGDARKAFAIDHPEPLLQFALSSGSYSDPAVRMYTSKRVFQELEVAKEEYIHTAIRLRKEKKIVLPKIVDSFAKELSLSPAALMELIEHSMPENLRKSFRQQHKQENIWKKIEWIPHNFSFRYLLSNELSK